jgi:arsenate reductase
MRRPSIPEIILGDMADLTLLHNPKCSTSRYALGECVAGGLRADVVLYINNPLDRAALLELMGQLEDPPADLVRKDSYFDELGLDAGDYVTAEAVADLLAEHPRLVQRPVLIKDGRAIIGRPATRVPAFLYGQ